MGKPKASLSYMALRGAASVRTVDVARVVHRVRAHLTSRVSRGGGGASGGAGRVLMKMDCEGVPATASDLAALVPRSSNLAPCLGSFTMLHRASGPILSHAAAPLNREGAFRCPFASTIRVSRDHRV